MRSTARSIMSARPVDAAEMVRRQCLARTPLADFFRILLEDERSREDPWELITDGLWP
jgi:hypothetical protein